MKLLIVGPRGNMGHFITQIASDRDDIEIVGGVGPKGRDYIGKDIGEVAAAGKLIGAPVVDDISALIDECDVIIDFSTVEMAMEVLDAAIARRKALVCGSTGFSAEQRQRFADAAAEIPVMLAANTSRMVNIMYRLLAETAELCGEECDIEILDMHSNTKKDSPSGTAGEMAETIAEAMGKDLGEVAVYGHHGSEPRKKGEIAFHSIRGGDISSSHIVYFVGTGERLEIATHSQSFKCFAAGAVDCAVYLADKPVGAYTVQDVFGLA